MRPPTNTAYTARANFRSRAKDKSFATHAMTQGRGEQRVIPDNCGHSLNMSYGFARKHANSLINDTGFRRGLDTIPLTSMSTHPTFKHPTVGTLYLINESIGSIKPFSPESILGWQRLPRENRGNYDKSKPALHMDNYARVGFGHLTQSSGIQSVFGAGNMEA